MIIKKLLELIRSINDKISYFEFKINKFVLDFMMMNSKNIKNEPDYIMKEDRLKVKHLNEE
jgi:hypothetical protein